MLLAGRGGKVQFWNMPTHSDLFNKACPQGKLVNHNLVYWNITKAWLTWGKGNRQLQPTLAILYHLHGEKKSAGCLVKFIVQKHRLIESLRPNHRTVECFPSPAPHQHIAKTVSFQHFPLTRTSCLVIKKRLQDIANGPWGAAEGLRQGPGERWRRSEMAVAMEMVGWDFCQQCAIYFGLYNEFIFYWVSSKKRLKIIVDGALSLQYAKPSFVITFIFMVKRRIRTQLSYRKSIILNSCYLASQTNLKCSCFPWESHV